MRKKVLFLLGIIFFINNFLFAIEKRKYNPNNKKKVLFLTQNTNIFNPVECFKKKFSDFDDCVSNAENGDEFGLQKTKKENASQIFVSTSSISLNLGHNKEAEDYEKLYQEGVNNFEEGNYKDALIIFSNLLSIYSSKQNIIEYLSISQKMILENSDDVKYKNLDDVVNNYLVMARACFNKKEYIKAYNLYFKIILIDQSRKKLYREILDIDNRMKIILKNRDSFNLYEYHYAKSYFLFKEGKINKCIDEWEKIVEFNSSLIEIQEYLIFFEDKNNRLKYDLKKINLFLKEGIKLYNNMKYEQALNCFYNVLFLSDDEIAKFYVKDCKLKISQKIKKQEMEYIQILKKEEKNKNKNIEKAYKEILNKLIYKD